MTTVDPHLQQLALQMIYSQRLAAPPNPNDLMTPILLDLTIYYTGFTAPDQVLENVETFKKLTKKMPALKHLAQVLIKRTVSNLNWNSSIPLRGTVHFKGTSPKDSRTLQHPQA